MVVQVNIAIVAYAMMGVLSVCALVSECLFPTQEVTAEIFRSLDTDNDGLVSVTELENLFLQ